MRKTILISLMLLCGILANAQKPEYVHSFARELKPLDWYRQQMKLWKAEIDKDRSNAEAWFHYYRCHRNLMKCDTSDKRSQDEKNKWIEDVIADMSKAVPNTYQYYLVAYMHGGNDLNKKMYLEKATELGKDRWEHLDMLAVQGLLSGNQKLCDESMLKLYRSGNISAGMMYYNYNVLAGCEQNAILFTMGDNDTYSALALQALGIRKDVRVINLHLLYINEYRALILRDLGLKQWDAGVEFSSESLERFRNEIIAYLASNKKGIPVNIAVTVDPSYFSKIEAELYLVGLNYRYSNKSLDNMAVLKYNFESVYKLDYITNPFYQEISEVIVNSLNCNYLVPLVKLHAHYRLSGDTKRAEEAKALAIHIATLNKDTEKLKGLFDSEN